MDQEVQLLIGGFLMIAAAPSEHGRSQRKCRTATRYEEYFAW